MIVPTNSERVIKMRESLINMTNRAIKAELENEKLREALGMMVDMVEMNGFGKAAALDIARTALENKHER